MIRINLISSPRNISTAFMYSFAQREDTIVLDEPFYAFYLSASGADHPGKEEVLISQSVNEQEVLHKILGPWNKPVLFIKNMAHHIELMDESFLEEVINLFFIRNPRQIISSYAQVINQPVMRDIGIEYQYHLFNRLKSRNLHPLVLDSGLLLENPKGVLKQLCEKIRIPFSERMLQWAAGPKPYDGIWAKHWYNNVHQSTGFDKQSTSSRPLPDHLQSLHEQALEYYHKLLPHSIKATM
jgi:hypothetical protein